MNVFADQPECGFVSRKPATDWQHGLLTGNGTLGAIVPGQPFDETLCLSHAGLFLPSPQSPVPVEMASRLATIRQLCLDGRYREASSHIEAARAACDFTEKRDRFIAALALSIRQPEFEVQEYRRSVDFLTAETSVAVRDGAGGTFIRSVFASRSSNVIVLRLAGDQPLSADFSFAPLPAHSEEEQSVLESGIRGIEHGTRDDLLYCRTLFKSPNDDNPLTGCIGLGRVIVANGTVETTPRGVLVRDAEEILVLVTIGLLRVDEDVTSREAGMKAELAALPGDYAALLQPHRDIHGELMERVRLSLDAPATEREKPTEDLLGPGDEVAATRARIERAFDAGRYNILCSTGYYPPNLQGLWTGTWLAPWYGSFTTNGNLPCAIAFLLMGNTPELLDAFFSYCDARWDGFRTNAQTLLGMPGFHLPAQLTVSPRATGFGTRHPHCFSHAGAAWALQFYYDYVQYTGDEDFLTTRTYPLMKEAASFYEAFLTETDDAGKVVFVPSYSPENAPIGQDHCATSINATMDVAACRQLLQNCIAVATQLDCDTDERERWSALIDRLPDYEVDDDGYFREWLWPGLAENNQHRHASHLYALYDEMPDAIVKQPELVAAVAQSVRARLDHHRREPVMAFGLVQVGLAAARIGRADLAQEAIDLLANHYWSTGMGSFHNREDLFNTDISGGFPYLCASALVYADPGRIVFFPARPESWRSGKLRGLRLRGSIVLKELTWSGGEAQATLVSDTDQTIQVEAPAHGTQTIALRAGEEQPLRLS